MILLQMKQKKQFWRKESTNRHITENTHKIKIIKGKIRAIRGHTAYFISDEDNTTVEISTRQINTAMAGD